MSFAKALVDFDNVAVGDADPAGANYTRSAHGALRNAKGRCSVVQWPKDASKGWDVTDQLKAGGIESLVALVRNPEAGPEFPASCWRRGFKEYRDAYSRCTEASDAYIWGAFAVTVGLVLGRNAKLRCGVEVFPNAYATNVGASGRARKTTPQSYMRRTIRGLDGPIEVSHGIGSPEGLIDMLDGGGKPKRVLVDLNELSTLLRKGAQEATRGLPVLLNTLFDCPPSVSLPNRKNPAEAEEPFLCVYGSTTVEWLQRDLSVENARGGLAGRFWYLVGSEKPPIAFPPPPDQEALQAAERVLREAEERHKELLEYPLSEEAREFWSHWYHSERRRTYSSSMLECVAQRLHLHAWKVALIFAAIEGSTTITLEQIRAACDFADYQREAQASIFHNLGGTDRMKIEERVRASLRKHGPLASWEIQQKVRHVDAYTLSQCLNSLARIGTIEERKNGRRKVWHLLETS